jgi:hypothetical protein
LENGHLPEGPESSARLRWRPQDFPLPVRSASLP